MKALDEVQAAIFGAITRLAPVDVELRELLLDAWRCQAPPALVRESGL